MTPCRPAPPVPSRRAVLRLPLQLAAVSTLAGLPLLGACTPRFNWREARSPGGEIRMQLPSRPASMTRPIHLRDEEVEMTMIGAEVDSLAFTVAIARGAPGATADDVARHLGDMRDQMLRNIAAAVGAPTRETSVRIPVVDDADKGRGQRDAIFIDARGSGRHEGVRLQGEFFVARRLAAQAIVIGRDFDEPASRHFFDSLRIVES